MWNPFKIIMELEQRVTRQELQMQATDVLLKEIVRQLSNKEKVLSDDDDARPKAGGK